MVAIRILAGVGSAVVLVLAGCGGETKPAATVTVTASSGAATESATAAAPSTADPSAPVSYGPDGLYSVGIARVGLPVVIPSGRYTVRKARSNESDGIVMRCKTVLCGPAYPQNADTTSTVRDLLNGDQYIFAMDVAVYLRNAVLTKIG